MAEVMIVLELAIATVVVYAGVMVAAQTVVGIVDGILAAGHNLDWVPAIEYD